MATALDYSSGRPTGAAVRAAGHAGVVRYAGTPGRTKNITRAEFQDMDRNGVGVALVYENKAGDALLGRAAGASAATAIAADARTIGFPATRPLYLAVDQDITNQMATVAEYFRGANSVLGVARTGAYGEADVLDALFAAGVISFGWQTAAWSKGRRAKKAHLYQRIGSTVVGGIDCDINDILATDWGQHNAQKEGDMELTDDVKLVNWGPTAPDNGNVRKVNDVFALLDARVNNLETWLRPGTGELAKKLDAATAPAAPVIDYDKLAAALGDHFADAVADKLAARLAQ